MVGNDPSSGQAALITTWIVPVKIVLSGGETYDPLARGNRQSAGQNHFVA